VRERKERMKQEGHGIDRIRMGRIREKELED
jgi:hypothetical protein